MTRDDQRTGRSCKPSYRLNQPVRSVQLVIGLAAAAVAVLRKRLTTLPDLWQAHQLATPIEHPTQLFWRRTSATSDI